MDSKKKQRKKQEIPTTETKQQKFVRVITPRVTKLLKQFKHIGNCTSAAYQFTPEQAEQILKAISEAYVTLNDKFTAKKAEAVLFKLS